MQDKPDNRDKPDKQKKSIREERWFMVIKHKKGESGLVNKHKRGERDSW